MLAPLVFMIFENESPVNLVVSDKPTKLQHQLAKLSALSNKL